MRSNEGNFDDGAWVQETINAVERSYPGTSMGDAAARVAAADVGATALDRFFATYYRQRPVAATFTGLHEHDGVLPDWSAAGLGRACDEMSALRRELATAGLVVDADVSGFPLQVDLALADGALEIALAEHHSGHFVHANPSMWTGEAIFGVISLITRDFAPLSVRLRSAHQRLEAIPAFLAEIAGLRRPRRPTGSTAPGVNARLRVGCSA